MDRGFNTKIPPGLQQHTQEICLADLLGAGKPSEGVRGLCRVMFLPGPGHQRETESGREWVMRLL